MIDRIEEQIPDGVRRVSAQLAERGHRAWLVGGCIRDLLMERPVNDWDLATSALPDEVQRIFRRTIPTGLQHGTVTVLDGADAYEVTTLRGEGEYTDGRHPDHVEFVSDIVEDLGRRDFTVNAIAYDPVGHEIIDPFSGLEDLRAKRVRAVRDPVERFREDGLRVLRAARFCATLDFELEDATRAAIPGCLETFRKVSPERVHEEWAKALTKSARPSRAFRVMRDTGILAITCPDLASLVDASFDDTMRRIDAAPPRREVRFAALLLSIRADPTERAVFVERWLTTLRPSNKELKAVAHLARYGQIEAPNALVDAALRHWLAAVGRDALTDVIAVARADAREVDALEARANDELVRGLPLAIRELPVNGEDVMRVLDERGRVVGQVLARLLERVLDDPQEGLRDTLLSAIPIIRRELPE